MKPNVFSKSSVQLYSLILFLSSFYTSAFAQVFPQELQNALTNSGTFFSVSNTGSAYVPNQLVVKLIDNANTGQVNTLRAQLGVVNVISCPCAPDLQIWEFGGTTGIEGRKVDADADSNVESVDFNYYNISQTSGTSLTAPAPLTAIPTIIPPSSGSELLIAIMDTGIDWGHDSLRNYIWRGPETANALDDDGNCYPDDFIGWNFVANHNNPRDDNSHGTHVAGIVVQNMKKASPNCTFKLLPIKTHNSNGVGTLFNITCGTYYAANRGAKIVNTSFGWYGDSSIVLSQAMQYARNVSGTLFSASAGNDSTNVGARRHYPSGYQKAYVISTTAIDSMNQFPAWSNFSSTEVDLGAYGVMVNSALPGNNWGRRSGSSMATPAVTALAAIYRCCLNLTTPEAMKTAVLNTTTPTPSLTGLTLTGGRTTFPGPNCNACNQVVSFTNTFSCLSATFAASPNNNGYTYSWTFGDGSTGSGRTPSKTYSSPGTYTVCVNMSYPTGCTATACQTIVIDSCKSVPDWESLIDNNRVTFTNKSLANGTRTYLWDFGDGTTSTATNPTKTYQPGTYTVCLTLTSSSCQGQTCCQTCCKTFTVGKYCTVKPNFYSRTVGNQVTFTNTSSPSTGVTYAWDFGNGQTSTAKNPVITYAAAGVYTVNLLVSNTVNGVACQESIERQVLVDAPCDLLPRARYKAMSPPRTIQFQDYSTGALVGWFWDFGDGNISHQKTPLHQYANNGTYTVCLTIYNTTCKATACYEVSISNNTCSNCAGSNREIIPQDLPASDGYLLSAWPNPLNLGESLVANIQSEKAIDGYLQLSNINGQVLWSSQIKQGEEASNISIPSTNLASGTYVLLFQPSDGSKPRHELIIISRP